MKLRNKRELIQFILDETKRQGFTQRELCVRAGYIPGFLAAAKRTNSITLHAAVCFLDLLNCSLEVNHNERS